MFIFLIFIFVANKDKKGDIKMVVQSHFVFGRDIKDAGVRKEEYCNTVADVCSIDISGDFSGEIIVEGKLDKNCDNYIALTGIDLSSFSLINSISKKGIYEFSVEGIQYVRINVKSISGTANIIGRFINTAA
jgi:hypothetical protein